MNYKTNIMNYHLTYKGVTNNELHGHESTNKDDIDCVVTEIVFDWQKDKVFYRVDIQGNILISSNHRVIHTFIFDSMRDRYDLKPDIYIKLYEYHTLEEALAKN